MSELSPLLAKKIQKIHFQTTHLANDILAGAYRSAFKGKGMEFEEVREFQPGDDVRAIDWNVTARMNRPYVKSFREERELNVNLLIDISASTRFGTGHQLKGDLIAEVAAVIAFSAIKNNDKVSLILFSDKVEAYIPPNKGTRHVLTIIRDLLMVQPRHPRTDISAALSFFGGVQHRSGICFLISDFFCGDYSREAAIISRHHDLIALAVADPLEYSMVPMGVVSFTDMETGEQHFIDTSSPGVKRCLQENYTARMNQQKMLMDRLGAGFVTLTTDHSYMPSLRKFFLLRQKRWR